MEKFTFKASHNKGTIKLTTFATSKEQAIEQICKAERCPPSALVFIPNVIKTK